MNANKDKNSKKEDDKIEVKKLQAKNTRINTNKELDNKEQIVRVNKEYLENLVLDADFEEDSGEVASYIPELGTALKEKTGISICYIDNPIPISAGDCSSDKRSRPFGKVDQENRLEDDMFTIQSISKVFALLYVLDCRGEDFVFKRIHKEPTGDPFNADPKTTKSKGGEKRIPFNPMINVGAIFITSLFPDVLPEEGVTGEVIEEAKGIIKVATDARIYRMSELAIRKIENEGVSDQVKKKLTLFYGTEIEEVNSLHKTKKTTNYYMTRDELKKKLSLVLSDEEQKDYLNKVLDYCNDGKFKLFMDFVCRMCNDSSMIVDHAVWESESATGHNNRALAWRMHADKIFFTERGKRRDSYEEVNYIEDVLSTYFRQCSILVNSNHLAHAAAVMAGGGKLPGSHISPFKYKKVNEALLASVISIMSNCGLYDGSGEFAYRIGLPGKSGVGGGIMCVVPGIAGIAVFSPALDSKGNSARGLYMLEKLSERFRYNIFNRNRIKGFKLKISKEKIERLLHDVKYSYDAPKDCQPADYIPELGANKASKTAVAICIPGQPIKVYGSTNDHKETFSLQSIANLFGLLYVLHEKSEGMVFRYVGKEPSGGSFNEMKWTINQSNGSMAPFNPMINAGAIAIASMIPDNYNDLGRNFNQLWLNEGGILDYYPGKNSLLEVDNDEKRKYVNDSRSRLKNKHVRRSEIIDELLCIFPFIEFVRKLCGDSTSRKIRVDWDLFLSERKTGHNNRSLAWQMNDNKFFDNILARHEIYNTKEEGIIEDILNVYFQMCSLKVSLKHLAYFAGVLANGGKDLGDKGEQLLTPREVAIATSMMSTSGLYNESGDFAYNVGIPSKSGVSGGIVGVVPGKLGIAVYSPSVDSKGNSCRGMKLLQDISKLEDLSIFK
ncbi:MAG: glutaminase [Bacteroidota bacterium]